MLDYFSALILGVVEGLTEFLPVSSTGHLIVVGHLIGVSGEKVETFEIFIQAGAILAVVVLYLRRFLALLDFSKAGDVHGFSGIAGLTRLGVACLPAFVLGALFHGVIKEKLFAPVPVACALIAGGVIMILVERRNHVQRRISLEEISIREAFLVGVCQCFALWPGVSRSASTIIGGLFVGFSRTLAAEFSFLVAVPTMFAAVGYDLLKSAGVIEAADLRIFALGFIVSFFTAAAAIKIFLSFVQRFSLRAFAYYRIAAGIVVLLLFADGNAFATPVNEEFRAAHTNFFRLLTGEGKDVELRYILQPKSESSDDNGRFSLQETDFSAEIPIPVTRDLFFRIAPEVSSRFYDFQGVVLADRDPGYATLYKIVTGIGAGYFINDQLLVTGKFEPAIVSDLDAELNSDQFRYFGQAVVAYEIKPRLQLIGGVVTNRLFQGTEVYPVAAIRYQTPDEKWHMKFTPPVDARIGYWVNSENQLFARFWQNGDDYAVFYQEANLKFDVRIEDRRFGVGLLHLLPENFNLSVEMGVAVDGKFRFKVDVPDLPNQDADPSFYALVSFGYSL